MAKNADTDEDTAVSSNTPETGPQHVPGPQRPAAQSGYGLCPQINEKLWEGRYSPVWPDGKKHASNVYANSEEECEKPLAELIAKMKAEISAEKERLKATPKAG